MSPYFAQFVTSRSDTKWKYLADRINQTVKGQLVIMRDPDLDSKPIVVMDAGIVDSSQAHDKHEAKKWKKPFCMRTEICSA